VFPRAARWRFVGGVRVAEKQQAAGSLWVWRALN
jgi:hypothetical protein